MSKKILSLLVISLLFLTSCGNEIKKTETPIKTDNSIKTEKSQKSINPIVQEAELSDFRKARKESLLKDMNPKDATIFKEFDVAKSSNNFEEARELYTQIKEKEQEIITELEGVANSGDKDKAKALRKELRIYSLYRQEYEYMY